MTAYYNEIDPHAAQWLRNLIKEGHIADGIVDERSIEDVTPADLEGFTQVHCFAGIGLWSLALRRAGWQDDWPIWTGSCPCQPFSAAGEGKGFADERHLWPAWHWLIDQCRPPKILGEQVASKDGLGWLDLVSADLEGSGYSIGAADLCAAGFGAFHIRQRLWFIASAWPVAHSDNAGPQGRFVLPKRPGECAPGSGGLGGFGMADTDIEQRDGGRGTGARGWQEPSDLGGIGGMGHSTGTGPLPGPHATVYRGEEGSGSRHVEPERFGSAGRMADADSGQCHGVAEVGGGNVSDGPQTGWDQGDGESELSGSDSGVGNTNGAEQPPRDLQSIRASEGPEHSAQPSVSEYYWHPCQDGKYRPIPVEQSFFPLAHGNPGRVGKLRAYGNGIHVETATAWCKVALCP